MHYVILSCLVGSALAAGSFSSRGKMATTPLAIEDFDPFQADGKWYITYVLSPDSWRGADEFTDWYQFFQANQTTFTGVDVWRSPGISEQCSRTPFLLSSGESSYLLAHSTGGATSGSAIIIDTDYIGFLLLWGCSKQTVYTDTCGDFSILVKTRSPTPSVDTLRLVDELMRRSWDVTTADIVRIDQSNPCRYEGEPDYNGNLPNNNINNNIGPDAWQSRRRPMRGSRRRRVDPYINQGPAPSRRRLRDPYRGPASGPNFLRF